MRTFRTCMVVLVSAAALGFIAGADEKQVGKGGGKHAGFERIKALRGEWEVTGGPGEHGAHGGTVSYKVTAGGSASPGSSASTRRRLCSGERSRRWSSV